MPLPRDVRRAPVHRLEDRRRGADVGARRETEPADQAGDLVAQDVAEHVGGHHHVELLGPDDELHGGVVDDHVVRLHPALVLPCDAAAHLQEEPAHHLEDVRLVDDGDLLPAVPEGVLEGVAHDPLAARRG